MPEVPVGVARPAHAPHGAVPNRASVTGLKANGSNHAFPRPMPPRISTSVLHLVGALRVSWRVERRAGRGDVERRAAGEAQDVVHLPAADDRRHHAAAVQPAAPGPNGSSVRFVICRLCVRSNGLIARSGGRTPGSGSGRAVAVAARRRCPSTSTACSRRRAGTRWRSVDRAAPAARRSGCRRWS